MGSSWLPLLENNRTLTGQKTVGQEQSCLTAAWSEWTQLVHCPPAKDDSGDDAAAPPRSQSRGRRQKKVKERKR